ncbi:MAG: branched-chain amino acid ABC transporter permease [Acidimicrobiia bacterium]|nr:branched-chain amino acid ABC transporter permease [Acidimicrobiia bacterium]
MRRSPFLRTRYEQQLRLAPTRAKQLALLALAVAYFVVPSILGESFWLTVLNFAGITAIGAVGLNLLTGYTGQVSLGHAAFLGIGAYTAGYLGVTRGYDLYVWLPAAAVLGALVGGVVGLVALRLRGNYLAIVTVGLVFLMQHVFRNWDTVTGGTRGLSAVRDDGGSAAAIGGLDFGRLEVFGQTYTLDQGFFFLIWGVLFLSLLVAKNVVRTNPGRAMQAVRDRDVAAEVVGVSLFRTKVGAFALASAFAAIAGALNGAFKGFVSPAEFNLLLSIQYVAIVIVGGVGTLYGAMLGALVIGALPEIVGRYSDSIPFLAEPTATTGVTPAILSQILYGLLIVLFLMFEPGGWRRCGDGSRPIS